MTHADLTLGNAASMRDLANGSARLIVTSPPYFPDRLEPVLARARSEQKDFDQVERDVLSYALTLRAAFTEMRRVLRPDGVLVLQTKDLRYGDWLIALADAHAELALQAGFHLIGKVAWAPQPVSVKRLPVYCRRPRVGNFRPLEVEWFVVFGHTVPPTPREILRPTADWSRLADPLWHTVPNRRARRHPYGSPPAVVQRWIQLFSEPGDLVVDPFAGYGTTVMEAVRLGREARGYEIDPATLEAAQEAMK